MAQDKFNRMISEIFNEYYKPLGWKKQGSNYRRIDESGLGKIINFQKSRWNSDGKIDFFINYGLYMEVGNDLVNKSFKEYECQFRNRTELHNGIYHLNEDTDYEKVKKEVREALAEATNLFEKVDDKETFVSMILSGEMQKYTGTPVMHYYTCKLLSDMGYYEEIYEFVKSRGGLYFDSLSTEIELKLDTCVGDCIKGCDSQKKPACPN